MIEVDARDFHGDRKLLAKLLSEKLRVETRVERGKIWIADEKLRGPVHSLQDFKDALKRALHHMGMSDYHVTAQKGVLMIRERRVRELHERKKGTVPSPQQTVPYFFPG